MGFAMGIVGLPNVGKSTLFNALTQTASAQAANFPFCTIEPNVGRVAVPDTRLETLFKLAKSAKMLPTGLEFVDIAGLVAGASKGEGLGNQFLANIRETDAIAHVVRCFEGEVTHVSGSVDPLRDIAVIDTELMLADLSTVEKRIAAVEKKAKSGDAEAKEQLALLQRCAEALNNGQPLRGLGLSDDEKASLQAAGAGGLLTAKPVLYVANVEETAAATGNALSLRVQEHAKSEGAACVVVSAEIESQIAQLPTEDRADFLAELNLTEPGLNRVIKAGYDLLGLLTFFTVGPQEARAWTVKKGARAPQAAGVIHTDFERGFIKADTIAFADFVAAGSETAAKETGKLRMEGKEYIVQDGDIFHFKFNV